MATDQELLALASQTDFSQFVEVDKLRGLPKVKLREMLDELHKQIPIFDEELGSTVKLSVAFSQYIAALAGRPHLSDQDRQTLSLYVQVEICRASIPMIEAEIQRREDEDAQFAAMVERRKAERQQ